MRRILTVILISVMILNYVSVALAGIGRSETKAQNTSKKYPINTVRKGYYMSFEYEIVDNEVIITNGTECKGEVTVPNTIENMPVTGIAKQAFCESEISCIYMPSIINIGECAFSDCKNLENVEMSAVRLIDDSCFFNCINLEYISAYVLETVGDSAFYNCFSLRDFNAPNLKNIGKNAFYCCQSLNSMYLPSIREIGDEAFSFCVSMKKISIPNVETVNGSAFAGCMNLTAFEISSGNKNYSSVGAILCNKSVSCIIAYPSAKGNLAFTGQVTEVGDYAFEYCSALTHISMQDTTRIGKYAFAHCPNLIMAKAENAKLIDEGAFYVCKDLSQISFSSAEKIEDKAFSFCMSMTEQVFPNVKYIGERAFEDCSSMTSVKLNNLSEMSDGAFINCFCLKSLSMPNVQKIGYNAFIGCDALMEFGVGSQNSQFSEENGILYNKDKTKLISCPNATVNVDVLDSVREIEKYAFAYTYEIREINLSNVETIGEYAFINSNVERINGRKVTKIKANAFEDSMAAKINMPQLTTIEERAFNNCINLQIINAESIKDIGSMAFGKCQMIESIELPSIKTIGDDAFINCKELHRVILSDCLEKLSSKAFRGCRVLTQISIPESNKAYSINAAMILSRDGKTLVEYPSAHGNIVLPSKIVRIGSYAFSLCDELNAVNTMYATDIYKSAFYGSSIENVHLMNISFLDDSAFAECENLKKVKFYCDSPEILGDGILENSDNAVLYYLKGTAGWDEWGDINKKEFSIAEGDVNLDDVFNTADAVTILRYAAGIIDLMAAQRKTADINSDSVINTSDAVWILKLAANG